MEFRAAKAKKHAPRLKRTSPFPGKTKLKGIFNGFNVTISDRDSMNYIYNEGNFGKGSLSKSAPNYNIKNDDIPKIIWDQQFKNESNWKSNISQIDKECRNDCFEVSRDSVSKFLTFATRGNEQISWKSWKKQKGGADDCNERLSQISDSKNENCMKLLEFTDDLIADEGEEADQHFRKMVNDILESKKSMKMDEVKRKSEEKVIVIKVNSDRNSGEVSIDNIEAKLETRPFPLSDTLNLNLEEAFFLSYSLNSLTIFDVNNSMLNAKELWKKFTNAQNNFLERYVVYHYYKMKGWIVHSGLKYGGDYLLYKDGPAYNHASYLVKILNGKTNFSWENFLAINRLVETFNKDIVFCTVVHDESYSVEESVFPESLKNYRVQEVMSRRWFPSKERIVSDDNS